VLFLIRLFSRKHILRELYSKELNWKGSMLPMPTLSRLGSVGGDACFVY